MNQTRKKEEVVPMQDESTARNVDQIGSNVVAADVNDNANWPEEFNQWIDQALSYDLVYA